MTTRTLIILFALTLAACGGGGSSGFDAGGPDESVTGADEELRSGPFKMLVYSRTVGFRHASIEAGIAAMQMLGANNGFEVDATEDPTQFTAENLAQYEVVMFLNTTLDVLNDTQQAVFENFVNAGGGYVGIHSAADTEHEWPFYGELVGAYFRTHPVQQLGEFVIEDEGEPSVSHLPNPWTIFDEFYSFVDNPRGTVNVLMRVDESSYQQNPNTSCLPDSQTFPNGYNGEMGDHPMAWCHDKFAGRAWYTALGHETYLYTHQPFLDHVLNGIYTATRRVAADCSVDEAVSDFEPHPLEPCTDIQPSP